MCPWSKALDRIYSNGPRKDFVQRPFQQMITASQNLWIAAPYVTKTDALVEAAKAGKNIRLLVGLNDCTSAKALKMLQGSASTRFFTRKFHAKIYVFDNAAMLGSSNLTEGGLFSNREATICLDEPDDLSEIRGLFQELWESASVLTPQKLSQFEGMYSSVRNGRPEFDARLEGVIGISEPTNIRAGSERPSKERLFLQQLSREIYEEYKPAFHEVMKVLTDNRLNRGDLSEIGPAMETNRFLNWVRLSKAVGEDAWRETPVRLDPADRRREILQLGQEWVGAERSKVPADYTDWLTTVRQVFANRDTIRDASKDRLTDGLLSIHAFHEQLRWKGGGKAGLSERFWSANDQDADRVKRSLSFLLFGPGEFVERFHDFLYDPDFTLRYFGYFCALELFGTVRPDLYPPINGRMAKALRFIGFDVRGT